MNDEIYGSIVIKLLSDCIAYISASRVVVGLRQLPMNALRCGLLGGELAHSLSRLHHMLNRLYTYLLTGRAQYQVKKRRVQRGWERHRRFKALWVSRAFVIISTTVGGLSSTIIHLYKNYM